MAPPAGAPDSDCSISINRAELIFGSDKALILAALGRDLLALFLLAAGEPVGEGAADACDLLLLLLLLLGEHRLPSAVLEPNCEWSRSET